MFHSIIACFWNLSEAPIIIQQEGEKAIQETTSQESVDLSKRGFLCKTGEKAIALTGINTVAKIGLLGTLGSLLVSEEAEAAKNQIIKVGPYRIAVTKMKKTKHKGKTYSFPSEIDENTLQNITIEDISKYFLPWIKETQSHKTHSIIYQYILPIVHLLVGQVHIDNKEGDIKTARNHLQKAKKISLKNNQYFYYCKTGYYLSKLEFDEYKSTTKNDKGYLKEIKHISKIISKIKSNKTIWKQEGAERFNILFADIRILSGTYLRTGFSEPSAAFSDLFRGEKYINNQTKIDSYQRTILSALDAYKTAMKYVSIKERPEAYYYAAEILMYFCVDRDNWHEAEGIYTKLLPVVKQSDMPESQKQEWIQTINTNMQRIQSSVHKWKQFRINSTLRPEGDHDLYVADDGTGKVWVQHELSKSDKEYGIKYWTMKWFDFPERADDPNDFESVALYIKGREWPGVKKDGWRLHYTEITYDEMYKNK